MGILNNTFLFLSLLTATLVKAQTSFPYTVCGTNATTQSDSFCQKTIPYSCCARITNATRASTTATNYTN